MFYNLLKLVSKGGIEGPLDSKKIAKNLEIEGKIGKKRKNREKEEKSGRNDKNREGSFILHLLTDRAGYHGYATRGVIGRVCEWFTTTQDLKSYQIILDMLELAG